MKISQPLLDRLPLGARVITQPFGRWHKDYQSPIDGASIWRDGLRTARFTSRELADLQLYVTRIQI